MIGLNVSCRLYLKLKYDSKNVFSDFDKKEYIRVR